MSFFELDEKTIQCKEWEGIIQDVPSEEDFKRFCNFCLDYVQNSSDYTETVLQLMKGIDSPDAEKTIEEIKVIDQNRRIEDKKKKKERKQKEEMEKKIQKSKRNSYVYPGCFSILFMFIGIVCLYGNNKAVEEGIIFVVISALLVSGAVGNYLKNHKNSN